MGNERTSTPDFSSIGWGLLLIWWGVVIVLDPLTISMGAIGTGLICFGLNAARRMKGIPTRSSTTFIGVIAVVWGALDTLFNLSFELSFAALMIVIGAVWLVTDLLETRGADASHARS